MQWNETKKRRPQEPMHQHQWDRAPKYLFDSATSSRADRDAYRANIQSWIEGDGPNVWLILSYAYARNEIHRDFVAIHAKIDRFLNRLCQKAYGKKSLRAGRERPHSFGFFEHLATNKHCNLLVCGDEKMIAAISEHGEKIWRRCANARGFHIEIINDAAAVVNYCQKEQFQLADYSSVYTYKLGNNRNR